MSAQTLVNVEALSKHYQQAASTIAVLSELSFTLEKGETLAIVGQSGSGKSTLLSLLAGLDQPSSGRILIDGQDLGGMSQNQLTHFRGSKVGIVFQQFHLLRNLTALENVMLPLDILSRPRAKETALAALELVGLGARAQHVPQKLSGGECQRVAIARAFVVEPQLLLADEPSGNLDSKTGARVMDLLFQAVAERGMTMILVTHDHQLAQRCQRQLVLGAAAAG